MSQNIIIQETEPNTFEVVVRDDTGSKSEHAVHIDEGYLKKLGWELQDTGTLLRESFEFLLERESKEAILKEFDLRDISKYFPEYEKTISK